MRKNTKLIKYCYLAKLSIAEGISFIKSTKTQMSGYTVVRDHDRFNVLASCPLKCFNCSAKATHCLVEHHRNDCGGKSVFRLNFYSGNKMMTWDHIVPTSCGGSDNVANARIACESCNSNRGNDMTLKELLWTLKQDPQILYKTKRQVPASLKRLIKGASTIARGDPNPPKLKLSQFNSLIEGI